MPFSIPWLSSSAAARRKNHWSTSKQKIYIAASFCNGVRCIIDGNDFRNGGGKGGGSQVDDRLFAWGEEKFIRLG